jgi:hypothetical protein
VNKVASFVGGIVNRLDSQMDILKGQITNYNAAISRMKMLMLQKSIGVSEITILTAIISNIPCSSKSESCIVFTTLRGTFRVQKKYCI